VLVAVRLLFLPVAAAAAAASVELWGPHPALQKTNTIKKSAKESAGKERADTQTKARLLTEAQNAFNKTCPPCVWLLALDQIRLRLWGANSKHVSAVAPAAPHAS
jgi:hypothetical protein